MVKLVELFDRTVPWEWDGTMMGATMAVFEVNNINYMVGFNPYSDMQEAFDLPDLQHEDVWLTGFASQIDGEWRQDTIGGTNPAVVSTIFRTFLEIVKAFLEEKRPVVLAIPAVADREKIYAQIAKRVASNAKELGYVFSGKEYATFPQFGQSVVFYFVRDDLT